MSLKRLLSRGWRKGQTMTEYVMIVAAVAIVVMVGYKLLGQGVSSKVNQIDTSITAS